MGYIKKLKNNELVGGTDKHTVYPVTSTKAVFEEVSENNFQSQEYLNNHIYGGEGGRINEESITDYNIAVGTVTKGKLTPQVQTMLDEGQKKALTPKGNYNSETEYEALDLVFDPVTNSSYISLVTPNVGHPVDENAEGYEEGWWEKTLDGTAVNTAQAAIDAKVGQLETQVGTAITQAEIAVDEAKQETLNAYTQAEALAQQITDWSSSEISSTPSYTDQHPLSNRASSAQVGYFECGTSSATQASNQIKAVTAGGYALPTSGGAVKIKMYAANTYTPTTNNPVKLQFNADATTLKELRYNNEAVSPTNTWEENEVISVYYDGTYYQASNAQGGGGKAEKIKYDNSTSGLAAINVQGALDEVNDDIHLGTIDTVINLSDYVTLQTWPNVGNDNKWTTNSSTYPYTGKFIPITPGRQYEIVAQESKLAQYALLKEEAYTNHANGTSVQYATGTTRTDVPAGTSVTVTAPTDAAYLYVTIYVGSDVSPSSVTEHYSPSIKEYIQDMDEEPTDDSNKLVSSGGVYDAIFDAAIMEDVPYNYTPGYKLDDNGTPIADPNYGISDFLECQYQDDITSYHGATDTVASMVVFNSSKTKVNYYRNNTSPSRTATVSNSNAAYFRVSFNLSYSNAGAALNGTRVFTPTGGPITAKDAINELQSEVNEIPNQIDTAIEKAKPSLKNLYMGTLVNSYQNDKGELQPGDSRSSTRVTNKSMLCVPYHGVKVTFKIPDNIAITIWGWILPQNNHSSSSGWLTSATTSYTFPDEIRAYRIIFVTNNTNHNGNIAASYVQGLIDSGDISFTYEDTYPNMLERNTYKSNLLRAALNVRPGHEPCIFSHISDVHGDVVRLKNFYEYSKYQKVDACLATGDYVTDNYGNRNEFINEVFDGEQLVLCVVGNHEFKNIGSADSYAEYTQTLAERYNYLEESGVVTTHNYYYYDIATKNIRVIAIDQFNGYYGSKDLGGKIGQDQLDWLVATLGSTPAGYGVCVIMHVPETAVIRDPDYDTFYEPTLNTHDGLYENAVRPITHIIDAFINKSTWSADYTNAQSESISISCDFTNRDASTEFIAVFCGHTHEDRVGLANIQTSRQVVFSTTIGNGLYGPISDGIWCNASDLPRGGRGVCQDCFNIYSIERSTKTVKVVRIGSDITTNMTDRKYMEIPYATT